MTFKESMQQQDFVTAVAKFDAMSDEEKQQSLKSLYYQSRDAQQPVAVAVLRRKLNDNKSFDDFYNAWLPPKDKMQPLEIGDIKYHHYFKSPVRVLNATNMNDDSDIISIGMIWCSEDELNDALAEESQSDSNVQRHDSISDVAEHVSVDMYLVKSDTQLGS